LVPTFAFMFKQ